MLVTEITAQSIDEALKKQLEQLNVSVESREVGTVIQVGDGIARVDGLLGLHVAVVAPRFHLYEYHGAVFVGHDVKVAVPQAPVAGHYAVTVGFEVACCLLLAPVAHVVVFCHAG
mgnify:CR=1 FL=1